MAFANTTVYLIPFCFDELSGFEKSLSQKASWKPLDPALLSTDFLLHYVHRITQDENRFRAYALDDLSSLDLYMYDDRLSLSSSPTIEEVRAFVFGTGVGFLAFYVTYGSLALEEIRDFSYHFKKSSPRREWYKIDEKSTLYETALSLLPENTMPFFACTADFKRECHCFHMLMCEADENRMQSVLQAFKRSYSTDFAPPASDGVNPYDMTYTPYTYDRWAGSQESLVNLVSLTDSKRINRYIDVMKSEQLKKDYLFMYLMLLNQRYTAMRYIERIADDKNIIESDTMAQLIAELKTAYSFRVVSNDMLYQNVYSRMYDVLDLDCLLADVHDNETRMAVLMSRQEAKADKQMNNALIWLTVLSVFSAALDAAGLYERVGIMQWYATLAALGSVVLVGVCALIQFFRQKK